MYVWGWVTAQGRMRSPTPALLAVMKTLYEMLVTWSLILVPDLSSGSGEPVLEEQRSPRGWRLGLVEGRLWQAATEQTVFRATGQQQLWHILNQRQGSEPILKEHVTRVRLPVLWARGVKTHGAWRGPSALAMDLCMFAFIE